MRIKIFSTILLVLSLQITGCSATITKFDNSLEDPDGNFILYISNQSYDLSIVDIFVKIDGEPVIHKYFWVKYQHNWKEFRFRLKPGIHRIYAESKKGQAKIDRTFEVKRKHWAVLNFLYFPKVEKPIPRSFSFHVSDKPVGFVRFNLKPQTQKVSGLNI